MRGEVALYSGARGVDHRDSRAAGPRFVSALFPFQFARFHFACPRSASWLRDRTANETRNSIETRSRFTTRAPIS